MKYFTSDWHINEDRIGLNGKPNLFYRNFDSIEEQNNTIVEAALSSKSSITKEDEFYHLGDVVYKWDKEVEAILSYLKEVIPCKWTLILGNYDEGKVQQLKEYFDEIVHSKTIILGSKEYNLNHYPVKCRDKQFSLTGHIHGLWKVQKNMINVGVDAWSFRFVDEDQIEFIRNACENYYDENVFPY